MNLQNFVVDAEKAVQFKLIREESDIEDPENVFHPEMCHQIFGENEKIFGYKDLKVNLFYSAGPMDVFFDVKYSKRVDDLDNREVLKADDIHNAVTDILPQGIPYYTNLQEFLTTMEKKSKSFEPFGEKLHEFTAQNRLFQIYLCDMNTPNFLKFHMRLETFVFWYIDAASRIDPDPQWQFFLIFEKYQNKNNETCYATVGYASIYLYYSYPDKIRPRISQVLVLPPFQGMGIGTSLIHTIYRHFQQQDKVTDITVEDAAENFQRLRCIIDVQLCKDLDCFSPDVIKNGLSKEMLEECQKQFKINPKQCRVIYEILRLAATNKDNKDEYKAYRMEIKKRLNMNYLKQKRDLKRVMDRGVKNIDPEKLMMISVEERLEQLNGEYQEAEKYYEEILAKTGIKI